MKKDEATIGAKVRCSDPDSFQTDLARKLRNRVGVIERFQQFSGLPIVRFPAEGRRKELTWVPPNWFFVDLAGDA